MPTVELAQGTIHYRQAGPGDGRPIVFVHGYLMAGDLWQDVGERLAERGLRAIMPTWPLGAQPEPMRPGADVTMRGVAAIVAGLPRGARARRRRPGRQRQRRRDRPGRRGRPPPAARRARADQLRHVRELPAELLQGPGRRRQAAGRAQGSADADAHRRGPPFPARLRDALARRRRPPRPRLGRAGLRAARGDGRPAPLHGRRSTRRSRSTPPPACRGSTGPCCWRGRSTTGCSPSSTRTGSPRCCPTPAWRRSPARGRSR